MPAKGKYRRAWWFASGVAALAGVGAVVDATRPDELQPPARSARQSEYTGRSSVSVVYSAAALAATSGHCGTATTAATASVDARVAWRIYYGELHGSEVSADVARVRGDGKLLRALASSNEAAVYAAVNVLVYTHHWHIVRLRVVKSGRVIADIGGPYIIAPVSGALQWQGRKVGSYVMSVQDDLGYVKLVSRFIGVPIDLYETPPAHGSFVMGTLKPAPPASVQNGQSVTVGGGAYQAHALTALAFPTGTLRAVLFVPSSTNTMAARSCAAVQVAAWGNVAKHVAARFTPLSAHYRDFVGTLEGATANLAYVRAGSKQLAGGPGPARIPRSGTVKYRGRSWSVYSWEPAPPARIYFLTPPG